VKAAKSTQSQLQLVTGCNRKYFISAINLVESFRRFHPGARVHFFWFDLPPEWLEWMHKWGGDALEIEQIPATVLHAHEAGLFYWKTWLLQKTASEAREDQRFIYLDAATEVKAPLDFVDDQLISNDHVFFDLPNKIGDWATKLCLSKLGADTPDYTEANQIHANVIGFRASERIKRLFREWEVHMRDVEIAGPIASTKRPDGEKARCVAHRCDQAVLSILLLRNGVLERADAQETARHVDWCAAGSQTVLCHRMPHRTCSMSVSTWIGLAKTGIVPADQALAMIPLVSLLKTPRQSFAWYARNHGKWGFGKRIRSLRGFFSPQRH
jgi:hypothetical protein